MNKRAALYARVSSEKQAQANTIDSQISAIREQINKDGNTLLKEYEFIDNGYTGSSIVRPGLESLRDCAANNMIDIVYIHSPDRLARKYAYQYLLIEELTKLDIKIKFMNSKLEDNPESNLLLQVQGIISEYERTKIMERSRRGKIHAAKSGAVSVLSGAPFGYRYIKKDEGGAFYEVIDEEAAIIKLIFSWVGYDRMSLNAATNKLTKMGFKTPSGKNSKWNRGTIYRLLKNPAYKGAAAFGKVKSISKKLSTRVKRGQSIISKNNCSVTRTDRENWIYIQVPEIISSELYELVQEQLEENKRLKRKRLKGIFYLLSGLVVCKKCTYSYCGNKNAKNRYYFCGGTKVYSNRDRLCVSKGMRTEILDEIVWDVTKNLLKDPVRLEHEYNRRIKELKKNSSYTKRKKLTLEKSSLENKINRIIDSYAEGIIEKKEFEPRLKIYRHKLAVVEQQISQLLDDQSVQTQLKLIVGKIEEFTLQINDKINEVDVQTKRNVIEALIKRIEVDDDEINIIFRVDPYSMEIEDNNFIEDCRKSTYSSVANFHITAPVGLMARLYNKSL